MRFVIALARLASLAIGKGPACGLGRRLHLLCLPAGRSVSGLRLVWATQVASGEWQLAKTEARSSKPED